MSALTADDVNKMKVTELRSELSSRELPTSGLKKQLVERLLEAIEGPQEPAADATGQNAGDAPEIADGAEKGTDNLPSEMPAVPPANEDSAADFEGKEPTLSEDKASNGIATSGEPSEVVRPEVTSVDPIPGVVSETKAPEDTTSLAGETGEKRKRDDEPSGDIAVQPVNEAPVEPVAVQEEKAEQANDPVPSAPADVDQPELKRAKLDNDAPVLPLNDGEANGSAAPANADDIPVVPAASNDVAKSVPSLKVKGASSSSSSSNPTLPPANTFSSSANADSQSASAVESDVHRGEQQQKGHVATEKASQDAKSFSIKGSSARLPSVDDSAVSTRGKAAMRDSMDVDAEVATGADQKASYADESDLDARPPPSASICLSNLVRPFTLPALREKLAAFGTVSYFWINIVKSHCYVTYDSEDGGIAASGALQDTIWPEVVGKPLDVVFLPTEMIAELVQKEEQAGRARLELQYSRDATTKAWQYDVAPPTAPTGGKKAAAVPRGLASALPAQARPNSNNPFPLGMPDRAPAGPSLAQDRSAPGSSRGRMFDQAQARSIAPPLSGSNALRPMPSTSVPSNRADTAQRESAAPPHQTSTNDGSEPIWKPATRAAEDLYKQTKATPQLFYRPVDIVAAGRRLRDIERENRKLSKPARNMPPGVRDSYRP